MNIDQYPKVAVIIPVYNAGSFFKTTLQSVRNQTLKDIEIICVLDNPTDGSGAVAESFAKEDERFIVITNTANIGVSQSRNVGIKRAVADKAEFIGFMDHDDYVEPEMFEKLYLYALSHKLEVVRCNTIIENGQYSEYSFFNDSSWNGIVSSILLPYGSSRNKNKMSRSVWNSLYRTEVVKDVYFLDRGLYHEEDTLYNLSVCTKTKSMGSIPDHLYHWRKSPTSQSNEILSHQIVCVRTLNHIEYEWQLIKANSLYAFINEFHIYVSLFLRQQRVTFPKLSIDYQRRLSRLLKECKFPVFGRYENLKIISRARVKLFFLVVKLKYFV